LVAVSVIGSRTFESTNKGKMTHRISVKYWLGTGWFSESIKPIRIH
jgi:hypothetical protein